jgi:hypothetical protein
MIDHWLKINEVEEFKNRIHTTIKDIYVTLKRKEQPPVVVGQELKWAALDSPFKSRGMECKLDRIRA